jgi:ppGpp synthetase/RelA/SpoT-type nucleotidyltranferase
METVDLIDYFINRYTKEYDFYDQAGRLAAQRLEADLQAAGVRSIVTSRAKSLTRLEQKCRQRDQLRGGYASVEDIYSDIVDLAGVRVALYFPGERDVVDGAIGRLFNVTSKKGFPEPDQVARYAKRFSGYSAIHYRVQLKDEDLDDSSKRYATARIEIQVASVLMHAWAEVEHDLVYKPSAGELSEEEYLLLDQLNGLVISGEISLERLQKAGEARVAVGGRRFENHYDLAAYLLGQAANSMGEPISDAGLGSVDLLYDLLSKFELDKPDSLVPYVEALHGDLERRPLAEQLIDALLAENPSRYEGYRTVRAQRHRTTFEADGQGEELYRHIGLFLSHWVDLERLVRQVSGRPAMPSGRQLLNLGLIDPDTLVEVDQLRQLRNLVVHGVENPSAEFLIDATERLQVIVERIRRGMSDGESAS